jgi:hypothetical protein
MKERRLTVVTVVRGGKVDIGDEIAAGAIWKPVPALENVSRGNVSLGTPVHTFRKRHRLSNFFTVDEESSAGRAGTNVSKPSATASTAAIELCCLSTAVNVTKEN